MFFRARERKKSDRTQTRSLRGALRVTLPQPMPKKFREPRLARQERRRIRIERGGLRLFYRAWRRPIYLCDPHPMRPALHNARNAPRALRREPARAVPNHPQSQGLRKNGCSAGLCPAHFQQMCSQPHQILVRRQNSESIGDRAMPRLTQPARDIRAACLHLMKPRSGEWIYFARTRKFVCTKVD